jgi:hypothetical protein
MKRFFAGTLAIAAAASLSNMAAAQQAQDLKAAAGKPYKQAQLPRYARRRATPAGPEHRPGVARRIRRL